MYVKAAPRGGRDTVFAVNDSEVTTGRLTIHDELVGEQVLAELGLEPSSTVMRFLADEDKPSFLLPEGEGPGRGWDLSYAYWWDWEKGFLRLVVADGPLFVIGDNGKTIDRAR